MAIDRTRFNFNGKTRLTKKALMYEVIKKYLDQNNYITFEKLKSTFPNKSDFNVDMFVDDDTYLSFNYDRKNRYFQEPFELNNRENIYLSTQWGGEVFTSLLENIKNSLNYDIQIYSQDTITNAPTINDEEQEFRKKYKKFVDTLPLQNSGEYAKLYTESQNKPFKVNKNSSGSIVVRAFTQQSSPMVVSANQLSKVLFNNDRYLYSSYEPVLINRIDNDLMINVGEVVEDIDDPNPLPGPEINKIKNIILYGSPGVGKTHNTKKSISLIESGKSEKEIFQIIKNNELNDVVDIEDIKDRVKFITFHQSFGYEDFIEGFRPNENGDIKLQDGIFKTICDDANNDREKNYYLVIDEINRGNISKIFGELITLIEEDKRDTLEVTLPYSKKPFKIPSNLYIIGTMNSTDKSIALIDIALRRRFTFLKMEPNLELVDNEKAKNIMQKLNEKITETLGADYVFGHSYFMKIENDDDLEFVLEYKIKPLLEEYFYGDKDGLDEILEIVNFL